MLSNTAAAISLIPPAHLQYKLALCKMQRWEHGQENCYICYVLNVGAIGWGYSGSQLTFPLTLWDVTLLNIFPFRISKATTENGCCQELVSEGSWEVFTSHIQLEQERGHVSLWKQEQELSGRSNWCRFCLFFVRKFHPVGLSLSLFLFDVCGLKNKYLIYLNYIDKLKNRRRILEN